MNQYATTYRKDYLWPFGKTYPLTPADQNPLIVGAPPRRALECNCEAMAKVMDQGDPLGPGCEPEQQWSRLGPMGPLLDAKLHPAKYGASPETRSSRYGQPNAFLQRLHEKYPVLYDVLQAAPESELLSRVNSDRMHTTYQVDYCGMTEYPSGKFDDLVGASGMDGLGPCVPTRKLPDDPCRPNQKPVAFRHATISKQGASQSTARKCSQSPITYSGVQTEYMDNISKIGGLILKENMHSHHSR